MELSIFSITNSIWNCITVRFVALLPFMLFWTLNKFQRILFDNNRWRSNSFHSSRTYEQCSYICALISFSFPYWLHVSISPCTVVFVILLFECPLPCTPGVVTPFTFTPLHSGKAGGMNCFPVETHLMLVDKQWFLVLAIKAIVSWTIHPICLIVTLYRKIADLAPRYWNLKMTNDCFTPKYVNMFLKATLAKKLAFNSAKENTAPSKTRGKPTSRCIHCATNVRTRGGKFTEDRFCW